MYLFFLNQCRVFNCYESSEPIEQIEPFIGATVKETTSESLSNSVMHNSNLMEGPQFFFWLIQGPKWYVLTHSKGVFIIETSKIKRIWGFAGHIKSFRGPHLARGPCVVHAWSNYFNHSQKQRYDWGGLVVGSVTMLGSSLKYSLRSVLKFGLTKS